MTDNLGQSQVIPYLVGLSKKGHDITILSCEKELNFERSEKNISKLLTDSNIKWCPVKYHARPPVLSTIYDIYGLKKKALLLHENHRFEIVHCRSYISAFTGLYLKRKFGVKFIFDMRGFWADERVDGKIWSLKNPIYKLIYNYFKSKEKEFLSQADYTISLTENGKQEIQSWQFIPEQPIPIKVIPCCADMAHFNYSDISEEMIIRKKQELGFGEKDFILSYLGSIGTWYLMDEMLVFFKLLRNKYPATKFFFISGDDQGYVKSRAEAVGIDPATIIVKKADRNEVPLFLSVSDISIFFIKPVYSKKASSPTKMGEIMSVGKPYICNGGVGDVEMIVNDSKTGILLNGFSEDDYNKAISAIDDILNLKPEYIRLQAEKYYSLRNGIEKYNEVYSELLI